MWKPTRSRAEQQFAAGQKRDQTLIKQKEKVQRERDERMARLRDLRLAKEAAEQAEADQSGGSRSVASDEARSETGAIDTAEAQENAEAGAPLLPRVHPHRS